jgi:biopolymer transport protein ExbD
MAFSTGNDNGPMATINVTPLVDVMLVLLIIFMITAPLMTHKVEIKLPEATLTKTEEPPKTPPITLAIQESGSLYWNDEPVTRRPRSRRSTSAATAPRSTAWSMKW